MRKFGGFGSPIKGSGADCRPRAASGGAVVVRRPFAVPLLAVMITMVLAAIISSVAYADTTPQALPLNQNFSDISLITTNDDWSGVPGVIGYRGDNLAAEGADPRTVTADGSSTPVNVAANKTNPSAFNTGSLAEFHQTNQSPPKDLDPTVAFQWNVQADAPHLVMTFNTTGQSNIRVSYLLRDIDCGSNDALQPVALRYRVGNSGAYTNLPGGYVADATSGPNLDVLNTPVSASLPAATDNQPFVQVRVITVNSVTSEEWIGIDTLSVASSNPAIDLNGGASGTGYSATFAEDGGSVAIVNSTALTATDADSPTLSSATATITNLQDGATESLSADTTGTPITASYNPATGVLTLSGAGTPAQYQQVLRTVRYNNTSEPPGTTARSVNFVVSDGTYSSNTATSTVTVNPANDAPTLSATATNPTYTENGTPVDVYSGVSASTVESGQSIDRLTLNVSNVSGGASEILNIDGTDVALTNGNSVTTATNGMTVSVSVSSGTATVTITKSGGVSAVVAGNVIDGMT